MTETDKETLEERISKRRKYLRTVADINMKILVATLFLWGGCFLAILLLVLCVVSVSIIGIYVMVPLCGLALCMTLAVFANKACESALKDRARIPYVPSITEQIAALPSEEILVRGSEQPAASPGELLRAAHAGKVDPAEELLRAAGQDNDLKREIGYDTHH